MAHLLLAGLVPVALTVGGCGRDVGEGERLMDAASSFSNFAKSEAGTVLWSRVNDATARCMSEAGFRYFPIASPPRPLAAVAPSDASLLPSGSPVVDGVEQLIRSGPGASATEPSAETEEQRYLDSLGANDAERYSRLLDADNPEACSVRAARSVAGADVLALAGLAEELPAQVQMAAASSSDVQVARQRVLDCAAVPRDDGGVGGAGALDFEGPIRSYLMTRAAADHPGVDLSDPTRISSAGAAVLGDLDTYRNEENELRTKVRGCLGEYVEVVRTAWGTALDSVAERQADSLKRLEQAARELDARG